jgi:hypothetical protein
METIKFAYDKANMRERLHCKAHDVRRMSTSWTLTKGIQLEEIMQAANWKSDSTFTAFYMRDVTGQQEKKPPSY